MSAKHPNNLAHSVQERLRNRAQLGPIDLEPDALRAVITDCARSKVEPDGWEYLAGSRVSIQPIRESTSYSGLRALFDARLGQSRIRMQLDVGSGDEVIPKPTRLVLPSLLKQDAPDLLCYSPYSSVAEKLEAMLVLGLANSRMKDYFDIAFLAQSMEFSGNSLCQAISGCCNRRGTVLPQRLPDGLHRRFATDDKAESRWRGFISKSHLGDHPSSWTETHRDCASFLTEPLLAAATGSQFTSHWRPGGPWRAQAP